MAIRLTAAMLLLALYAACSAWRPWSDAWCDCMWAADSTYFTMETYKLEHKLW
jgi:hypothetical protein